MSETMQGRRAGEGRVRLEILGLMGEAVPGQLRVPSRQHQSWRPPTDVYETDDFLVVKVEIAGVDEEDFSISLGAKKLVIAGVRYDPAAKLRYQQMEIPYGHFETEVHLTRAIEEEDVEATYRNGFLSVRLPKAKPRNVPVVSTEDTA